MRPECEEPPSSWTARITPMGGAILARGTKARASIYRIAKRLSDPLGEIHSISRPNQAKAPAFEWGIPRADKALGHLCYWRASQAYLLPTAQMLGLGPIQPLPTDARHQIP